VSGLPCPLFVPLVEEGWTDGVIAALIAEKYLEEIRNRDIDTLVLGCTHYPLLKKVIAKVMGEGVRLIDSAVEVAKEVKTILDNSGLSREEKEEPRREFYVTDSPLRFTKVGERFLENKIEHIELITEP
jgi:glutamate racemase